MRSAKEILADPKFCIVPFMLLNTRPNGTCKTCSQASELRAFHEDYTDDTIDSRIPLGQKELKFLNFTDNTLDEIWNSEFLKEFRMKKIRGEYIKSCENCYFEDSIGDGISKRYRFNRDYGEAHLDRVEEAMINSGRVEAPPTWWELRLSSECNSACRMCNAATSSLIRKQNEKYIDIIPIYDRVITDQATKFHKKWGYLGDNPRFYEEFWQNVETIRYIEFHGGEPLVDKNLLNLLQQLVDTGHAKNIYLNGYTNANVCSIEVLELLNKFAGGRVGVSIDAYGKQNDYLRWPAKWDKVEENIRNFKILGDNWDVRINAALTVYQVMDMMDFVNWYDDITQLDGMDMFKLVINVVKRPERMAIELIPLQHRERVAEELDLFIKTSYTCNESKHAKKNRGSLNSTCKLLRSTETASQTAMDEFKEYTKTLDQIRNQDVLTTFPKLGILYE